LSACPRSPVSRKAPRPECREAGNVLFYIFIAIAILGLLTYAISQTGEQQSSFGDLEQRNEEFPAAGLCRSPGRRRQSYGGQ